MLLLTLALLYTLFASSYQFQKKNSYSLFQRTIRAFFGALAENRVQIYNYFVKQETLWPLFF